MKAKKKTNRQPDTNKLKKAHQKIVALDANIRIGEEKLNYIEDTSLSWLERSPVCTKIVDPDFNLQYMSSAGIKALGIKDVVKFYGKPFPIDKSFPFYPDKSYSQMKRNLEKVKESGEIITEEGIVCNINGEEFWFNATLLPVHDNNGELDYIMIVSVDITERKKLERQLVQSQKMEAIGTLAGGIAHDFNNLLVPILGFSEIAQKNLKPGSNENEYLGHVIESAKVAKDLVEKILLISRSSTDHNEPVQLKNIVNEILTVLNASYPNVKIHEEIEFDIPLIHADISLMYQVILNLCTNAVQATFEKGELRIKLEKVKYKPHLQSKTKKSENFVRLTVQDNGCGMNAATIDRIYEPFFTTKAKGKQRGTGLGLSIVSSVIKQHKGFIEVDSIVGSGTVFQVYLPLSVNTQPRVIEDQANTSVSRRTEHILWVDDDHTVNKLGSKFLESLGYRVSVYHDCLEALNAFEKNPQDYHLLISDYTMPHLTGPELIEKAKAIRGDIPMFIITGHTDLATEMNRRQWNCDGIVTKPFNLEYFRQTLDQSLSK